MPVAPEIGLAVTPVAPTYHWKVGEVPEAAAVRVVEVPVLMARDAGWVVIAGGRPPVAVNVWYEGGKSWSEMTGTTDIR